MARFFLKHLLFLGLTLVVVSFLVFILTELTPGDVARKYLGAYATQEQVWICWRAKCGLIGPWSCGTSSTSATSYQAT